MSNSPIRPEDILPTGMDSAKIGPRQVRKGSVAAFVANIDLLENSQLDAASQTAILNLLKELAPAIVSVGLHRHVTFKNDRIEQLLIAADHKKA